MKKLYHFGIPCDPPVINGIKFAPCPENEGFYVGEVSDEMAFAFDGVHGFTETPEVPQAAPAVDNSGDTGIPQWAIDADAKADKLASLETENASLKEENANLKAQVGSLEAHVSELQAALEAEEQKEVDQEGIDALKADIEALEAKKSADGKLAPAEAMKLGKLKKKLETLTAPAAN